MNFFNNCNVAYKYRLIEPLSILIFSYVKDGAYTNKLLVIKELIENCYGQSIWYFNGVDLLSDIHLGVSKWIL
jgi:hypothetical protein